MREEIKTMIYFTADTHFGHANIVKMCERSYPDVESMNEAWVFICKQRWRIKLCG